LPALHPLYKRQDVKAEPQLGVNVACRHQAHKAHKGIQRDKLLLHV
jgi:hypothetical protein